MKETLPPEAAGVVVPKGLFDFFKGLLNFLGMMTLIALVFPLAFFRGWAIHRIYTWFVVPCGAPALSYMHCVGLSMALVGLSFFLYPKTSNGSIADAFKDIPRSLASLSFLVLLAWLLHLLIGPRL